MTNFLNKCKETACNMMAKATSWIMEKVEMFHIDSVVLALVSGWLVSVVAPLGFLFQCVLAAFITMASYLYYGPKTLDGKREQFVLIVIACIIALFFGIIF